MIDKLKQEYSTFIEEISEILGLGKPVDILKLCATTDRFLTPLQKRITGLEKELSKEKDRLDKAIWLIQNIVRVTWGEGWSYSLEWKAEAEKFLGEIEK